MNQTLNVEHDQAVNAAKYIVYTTSNCVLDVCRTVSKPIQNKKYSEKINK